MKKHTLIICIALVLLQSNIFAEDTISENEKNFIKGNIAEKITAVQEAASSKDTALAIKAIDFVIENQDKIKDDRDLAALAVTSVLTYPLDVYKNDKDKTVQKLSSIFYHFSDKNVRITVLDKLESFSLEESNLNTIVFINSFIESSSTLGNPETDVEKKAIDVLGKIGNASSYTILYKAYKAQCWPKLLLPIENSLVSLSDKSISEINNTIKKADFVELKTIYSIHINNKKSSETLKSEIAENILNRSMFITKETSQISKSMAQFQLEALNVLNQNKWTRASDLIISYFTAAKDTYNAKIITEDEFVQVIQCTVNLCSKDCVKRLVDYLGILNKEAENNEKPSTAVTLAVINALQKLGDRSAFDNLLLVTYNTNLPDEVIAAARDAIASLKWN